MDIIIRNGEHILLEITSRLMKKDIPAMNRSADDYRNREGVDPLLMAAAVYISPSVMMEVQESPRKIIIFTDDEEE